MNFLAPLFLVGAAAIALPILFHLIRRTPREQVPFSTLMFLTPSPPRVTKRSRIEHWFLLLLRCLAIALLALAFGRPFFQKQPQVDAGNGQGRRVVLLIDRSASMRRETLWPDAIARAQSLIEKARPGDEVALFTFDHGVQSIFTFEEWSQTQPGQRAALLNERMNASSAGWSAGHLGRALTRSVELLDAKAGKTALARELVIISDFQQGMHLEGLQGLEWPRDIRVRLETVSVKDRSNAGLQLIVADSDAAASNSAPRLRINNALDSQQDQFLIASAALKQPVRLFVPPGHGRVATPGALTGEAVRFDLSTDAHAFDNQLFFIAPRRGELTVLYAGDDSATNATSSRYYLQRALASSASVPILLEPFSGNSSSSNEQRARLLISTGKKLDTPQLAAWLAAGKTALIAPRSAEEFETIRGLPGLSSVSAREAGSSGYLMLGEIDFTHPLFASFADPRYSDFTKIQFWKHRIVENVGDGRVVARFENNNPALIHWSVGPGTLFVLTSGWNPGDSQLALSTKFLPLLFAVLEQSGGIQKLPSQFLVGESVPVAPVQAQGGSRTLTGPDNQKVDLAAAEPNYVPSAPGFYRIDPDGRQFAVNVPPEESRTSVLSPMALQQLGVPLEGASTASTTQQRDVAKHLLGAELEGRQKLWRWLLVGCLAVMVVETWLAARLSKPQTLVPA